LCGIVGLYDARAGAEIGPAVHAMADTIIHRGPDGGGVDVSDGVAVAMRRLAIVDVDHGQQPMASDDGSIVLVYNGEVYNAPALRAALEREGVAFRTRSDTEVILRLYERDPRGVENELVGMWAFAIHDRRRKRLVLSRDRFGIKPLFVASVGGSAETCGALAFASELQALETLRGHARFADHFELDRGAAHAMLSFSYIPEDATIYRGIRRLPPATRLEIDLATGKAEQLKYWQLRPCDDARRVRSLEEAVTLVEPVVARAVREHLESDVPIAAFLSGGIDSSLVAAYAVDASSRPIDAFTIGFGDPRFDEAPHARKVAAALGVRIHVDYLDESAMRHTLAAALLAYDEPFGDSSSLACYLLCRNVSRTHKVALGGDGGDEAFAGYRKHRIVRVRSALSAVPFARDALFRALNFLPKRVDRTRRWTEILRSAGRLERGLLREDGAAYVALTQIAALDRTRDLLEGAPPPGPFESEARARYDAFVGSPLEKTLASDLANVLPNDMLTKLDRASMACSLEARVPLLDHRVVEIGVGLPARFSLGANGKAVLREMFERRFGRELARRRKQGFGVPVERWLRTSLSGACDALFDEKRLRRDGLLSANALGGGRWRVWAERDPQVLWNAFALAVFCEARFGEGRQRVEALLAPARGSVAA
jgi:asparagine synthase (glutamine-hydrolysing)